MTPLLRVTESPGFGDSFDVSNLGGACPIPSNTSAYICIHLHAHTHTHLNTHSHTQECLNSGSTRCRRWGASWFVSRDERVDTVKMVGLFSLHLAAQPAPGSKGLVGSPSTPQVDFQAASSRGWRRGPSFLARARLLKWLKKN